MDGPGLMRPSRIKLSRSTATERAVVPGDTQAGGEIALGPDGRAGVLVRKPESDRGVFGQPASLGERPKFRPKRRDRCKGDGFVGTGEKVLETVPDESR